MSGDVINFPIPTHDAPKVGGALGLLNFLSAVENGLLTVAKTCNDPAASIWMLQTALNIRGVIQSSQTMAQLEASILKDVLKP